MAIFNTRKIKNGISRFLGSGNTFNTFNEAFYHLLGNGFKRYDDDAKSYLDEGYNKNPIVYAVIQQMATKTSAVPFEIKVVKDADVAKSYNLSYKNRVPEDLISFKKKMDTKKAAFSEKVMPMPFDTPNPNQTWEEFMALFKVFYRTTGNAYIYMLRPEEGKDSGQPIGVYLLPSHLMKIVVKPNSDMLNELESPIDYYMLIEGESYAKFTAEDVIHIKMANPNYDTVGSHLYGQSPLKAALQTMASTNEALKNNVKMMTNSGAFGIIHGKNEALTPNTAMQLKARLKEMDTSTERMSNLTGLSTEIGFTRINLTTDELKPFDYLNWDQKTICNVLGWSDKLLNNDAGAKYDNVNAFRKQVVTDNIVPDLEALAAGLNRYLFTKIKGYENAEIHFDVTQLPEMQQDTEKLVTWFSKLLADGVVTRAEFREALGFEEINSPEMQLHTVSMTIVPLKDAVMAMPEPSGKDPDAEEEEEEDPKKPKKPGKTKPRKTGQKEFNPNQPRDYRGRWTDGAAGGPESKKCFKEWFGDSKAVDEDGNPKEYYHGTTHGFEEFNDGRGNIENDFGIGHYFTSSLDDVQSNYDDLDGPDLTNRIEQMAEQLADRGENVDYDEATRIATAELSGGENRVIPAYLSLQNPLILDNRHYFKETEFDIVFDEETGEETGNAIDLLNALDRATSGFYDVNFDTVRSDFWDAMGGGTTGATYLLSKLRASEGLIYATGGNGKLAGNEILRLAAELAGFDAIIDRNVYRKFGAGRQFGRAMQGIYNDTEHIIVFESGQIKGVDNETFCDERNIYKSYKITEKFDPNQPRDNNGMWTDGGTAAPLKLDEITAIADYTDEGFVNVNNFLRRGQSKDDYYPGDTYEGLIKKVSDLENAIAKLPEHGGVVYRGLDLVGEGPKVWALNRKLKSANAIIEFKTFLSTSKEKGFPTDILEGGRSGGKYLFEIVSKTGKDVSKYGVTGESEVIFKPNTKFKIVDFKKDENTGYYKVKLKE